MTKDELIKSLENIPNGAEILTTLDNNDTEIKFAVGIKLGDEVVEVVLGGKNLFQEYLEDDFEIKELIEDSVLLYGDKDEYESYIKELL